MLRDPLTRLSTTTRLWLAVACCLLPIGSMWSQTLGFTSPGTIMPGLCDGYGYCTPDIAVPGTYTPGSVTMVSQSPIGPLLIAALALLIVAAARRRTPRTKRAVRAATLLVGASAVLAIADSYSDVWFPLLIALALTVPLVWRAPTATSDGGAPVGR